MVDVQQLTTMTDQQSIVTIIVIAGSTINKSNKFYNSRIWRETSKQVLLQNDYICAMCGGEATMTDHIVSVKQDWNKRLDLNNLQASCKACNDSKAIRERRKNNY